MVTVAECFEFTLSQHCALDVIVWICTCVAVNGEVTPAHRAMWADMLEEALAEAPLIAAPKGPDQVTMRSIAAHARALCDALRAEAKGGAYARASYELRSALHTFYEYRAGGALNLLSAMKGGRGHA